MLSDPERKELLEEIAKRRIEYEAERGAGSWSIGLENSDVYKRVCEEYSIDVAPKIDAIIARRGSLI
jgi:hypothetical protein